MRHGYASFQPRTRINQSANATGNKPQSASLTMAALPRWLRQAGQSHQGRGHVQLCFFMTRHPRDLARQQPEGAGCAPWRRLHQREDEGSTNRKSRLSGTDISSAPARYSSPCPIPFGLPHHPAPACQRAFFSRQAGAWSAPVSSTFSRSSPRASARAFIAHPQQQGLRVAV